MEKLKDFVTAINEHRGRPRKEINPDELSDKEKETIAKKAEKAEKAKGKDAEKNGSHGAWAVEPPYDDGAVTKLTKEDMNKNLKRLKMKFDAEEPFFIQGEAGWGKTSIIKDMAKRHKRHVITVYLDKAVATDLGGIPVPVEGEKGQAKIVNAMPDWAAYMLEHQDQKFLLFFDEMNQAAPDVMNALMPIVLENVICNIKYDNFMVGAAGNYENENGAVNELSGPLKSRFKPIIIWETGDDASWKQAFTYMHKNWDDKLSKELINDFEEAASTFENPREIEHKILKFIEKIKKSEDKDMYDVEDYLDRLEGLAKDDLTRTQEDNLKKLAEKIHAFVNGKEEKEESGRSGGRKGNDMIDDSIKAQIKEAMKYGYLRQEEDGKMVKYGISRENINQIFCDDFDGDGCNTEPINAEMLDRLINKFEADGVKFKYETNDEWKKAGLKDPLED